MLPQRHRFSQLPEPSPTFWPSLRYFDITRLFIAAILLALQGVSEVRFAQEPADALLFWQATMIYGALGLTFWLIGLRHQKRFYLQLVIRVVCDMLIMTVWLQASGGVKSSFGLLFLVPVAAGSILAPGILALFFAALATLCVLGHTIWQSLDGSMAEAPLFQAGLTGVLFFAAAALTRSLAGRLIRQEELAQRQRQTLRHQLEINRLIIGDLATGIVMLDADGRIHTSNRAAQRLLGLDRNASDLSQDTHLIPVRAAYDRWLEQGAPADATASIQLDVPGEAGALDKRMRLRFFNPQIEGAGDSVILIDDLGELSDQARQLKLAAMGRLTASIAHEVRNPLAAISHAGALLMEEPLTPLQTRLVDMIGDNAGRLNRIVENILQLARGRRQGTDRISICDWIHESVIKYCGDRNVDALRVSYALNACDVVVFDQNQLEPVIMNLLDNAFRYASDDIGAIRITTRFTDSTRMEVWVEDDGPGVAPLDRVQLFEPFHTTHPRGTGLGLYLAREFCLNNDADLQYLASPNRPAMGNGYGFVLRLARAAPLVTENPAQSLHAHGTIEPPTLNMP